jgi:short subunit dehydrogenase-like uncharacterized protein
MNARYDIIVYGATGFTGRQAVQYLDRHAGGALHWAVAGRNAAKLDALSATLTARPNRVVADANHDSAIDALVASTRVVLNTAGPFSRYAEALVRSCATRGVDYVDITGETPWVRRMIERYHQTAARSGAKIVPCCGFDSVPSDLGTHLLVQRFRRLGKATREVRAFHRAAGGVNGGTIASIASMLGQEEKRQFDDPFLLNPGEVHDAGETLANRDPQLPRYDPDLGRWVAPFVTGPINTRVVRRSHALSRQGQAPYGDGFRYQEYWSPRERTDFAASAVAALGIGLMQSLLRVPGAGRWNGAIGPAPGEGPSEHAMNSGYFECNFLGIADDATKCWARIAGDGDPGNRATTKFVCESALALALDRDRLGKGVTGAGLLTPATAFGDILIERLRVAGVTITCPAGRPS